jgi:hypothetical protein
MSEGPAEILRRAAMLLRERAEAATPGPWERPLDVERACFVGAALPDDELPTGHESGIIQDYGQRGYLGRYVGQRERCEVVAAPTMSDGSFIRGSLVPQGETRRPPSRSGWDLDYIASMHPVVGLAVARLLATTADLAAEALHVGTPECVHDEPCRCERRPSWGCDRCGEWLGGGCRCWDEPLAIACAYLGCTLAAIAVTAEGRVA